MSAAWFYPKKLESSRAYMCASKFGPGECEYYMQRWHFWYIADWVYALPTIAFFMCAIGIFIIARIFTAFFGYRRGRPTTSLKRFYAAGRYLSYRGFHVKALRWNSAPVGLLLLALIGTIYFFCMDLVPQPYYWSSLKFGNSPPLGTRSGWLALACMPFVFATASKANWITLVTGVSHESLQVFHRWISYAFFILALLHTFPFIVYHTNFGDMQKQFFTSNTFVYWTGCVAIVLQAWLTFASHSTIRNLGYEFFKIMHFAVIIVFMIVFFWHCGGTLTSWDYFIATAAVYVPALVYPWFRTIFEYGLGQRAHVVVEENDFIRITVPANFYWVPGAHCFLRFTEMGMHALSTHPFTICSLPTTTSSKKSELTFYVRQQGGFTNRLHKYALANPGASTPVWIDGPYGGANLQAFDASDRVVLIAGGSGAGWCLPFVELFARQSAALKDEESSEALNTRTSNESSLIANRGPSTLKVVLATRDVNTKLWFQQAIAEIMSQYHSDTTQAVVDVQVFVTTHNHEPANISQKLDQESDSENSIEKTTTQHNVHEKNSSTTAERIFSGRPRLADIVHDEAAIVAEGRESLAVYVCGPLTMQNDVRNAVAKENLAIVKGGTAASIYLHSEHFSWA